MTQLVELVDVDVVLGTSSGKGRVDETEQIPMVNSAEVAAFAKFLLNGKIINGFTFGVEAQNGLKNEPMFRTVKLIDFQDRAYGGNNLPFFHKHGGEKLFFHFDGFWHFIIHKNHLVRRERKRRHSLW